MKQYKITIRGASPLIMHADNIAAAERIGAWRKDPANKEACVRGDDRSPAWTWLSYLYHDRKVVGVPSDNLMTVLREGGSKVINSGKETFKKQTQSGIMLDQTQFPLYVQGETVDVGQFDPLLTDREFAHHLDAAEANRFELLVKRAKVGQAKHVRVRPMFRDWVAEGTLTVLDEELSGLTRETLSRILTQAGALCGLGDWRPSSPKSSGVFGRFTSEITPI